MTTVNKNIKKLRTARGLTQEALAARMNVTRQTVSSWETGRTQPDIDTLTALGETLGVGIEELIYGWSRPAAQQPRDTRRYRGLAIGFGSAAAVLTALWAWRNPGAYEMGLGDYLFSVYVPKLCWCAWTAAVISLLLVFADIRLRPRWARRTALAAGAALAALCLLLPVYYLLPLPMGTAALMALNTLTRHPELSLLPAALLYFGVARRRE